MSFVLRNSCGIAARARRGNSCQPPDPDSPGVFGFVPLIVPENIKQ